MGWLLLTIVGGFVAMFLCTVMAYPSYRDRKLRIAELERQLERLRNDL